jgi:hypothetical protein
MRYASTRKAYAEYEQRAKGQAKVWQGVPQSGEKTRQTEDSLIALAWSCTKFTNFFVAVTCISADR